MEILSRIISVALIAIFAENIIFSRGIGVSSMFAASKNKSELFGFGVIITFITTVSSIIAYFIGLKPGENDSSYIYMPLIYVLIIGVVYIITLLVVWRVAHKLFLEIKKFVHLSAFNCAVLGALFIHYYTKSTLLEYIGFGLGTGIGFILATYLLSIGYKKLNSNAIPDAFKGFPVMMIYVGILSMAFYGISGYSAGI